MQEKSTTIIYVIKEIMKLPVDKEQGTIKNTDVFDLIDKLSESISEEDVEEFMAQVKEAKAQPKEQD